MLVNNFIVCDFIKQENSRKYNFLGVYDDTIIISPANKAPAIVLPLAFYIRVRPNDEKEVMPESFKFTISFESDDSLAHDFAGKISAESGKKIAIVLSIFPFTIPYSAKRMNFKIAFFYADGKNKEHEFESMKILINEPASPKNMEFPAIGSPIPKKEKLHASKKEK